MNLSSIEVSILALSALLCIPSGWQSSRLEPGSITPITSLSNLKMCGSEMSRWHRKKPPIRQPAGGVVENEPIHGSPNLPVRNLGWTLLSGECSILCQATLCDMRFPPITTSIVSSAGRRTAIAGTRYGWAEQPSIPMFGGSDMKRGALTCQSVCSSWWMQSDLTSNDFWALEDLIRMNITWTKRKKDTNE